MQKLVLKTKPVNTVHEDEFVSCQKTTLLVWHCLFLPPACMQIIMYAYRFCRGIATNTAALVQAILCK